VKNLKLKFLLLLFIQLFVSAFVFASDTTLFLQSKNSAGKASLTSNGYYAGYTMATANFSPELRLPIQLAYDSSNQSTGILGFGWSIPQLESSVDSDDKGTIWTTPWGEKISFYSRKDTSKDILSVFNEKERENSYFSPFGDWTANGRADTGSWTFFGRKEMKGWKLTYASYRLTEIVAPSGQSLQFIYRDRVLAEIKQNNEAFVSLKFKDKTLSEIAVNGVKYNFEYDTNDITILPETLAGKPKEEKFPFLVIIYR